IKGQNKGHAVDIRAIKTIGKSDGAIEVVETLEMVMTEEWPTLSTSGNRIGISLTFMHPIGPVMMTPLPQGLQMPNHSLDDNGKVTSVLQ
ncbi:hypothetical protein HAX54_048826, partial [Datura stramonium]|nr:hypothetical protein [Datura stramonium]